MFPALQFLSRCSFLQRRIIGTTTSRPKETTERAFRSRSLFRFSVRASFLPRVQLMIIVTTVAWLLRDRRCRKKREALQRRVLRKLSGRTRRLRGNNSRSCNKCIRSRKNSPVKSASFRRASQASLRYYIFPYSSLGCGTESDFFMKSRKSCSARVNVLSRVLHQGEGKCGEK